MRKIKQVLDLNPFNDGEEIELDGLAPLDMQVICMGDAGVYLSQDEAEERLVGAGRGSFNVHVPALGSPYVLRFVSSLGLPLSASLSRQRETLYRSDEVQSFLVVKPRIHESEDMRAMRLALHLQRQQFEERMTEQRRELLAAIAPTKQEARNRAVTQPVPAPSDLEGRSAAPESVREQDEAIILDGDASDDPGPLPDSPSGAAEA